MAIALSVAMMTTSVSVSATEPETAAAAVEVNTEAEEAATEQTSVEDEKETVTATTETSEETSEESGITESAKEEATTTEAASEEATMEETTVEETTEVKTEETTTEEATTEAVAEGNIVTKEISSSATLNVSDEDSKTYTENFTDKTGYFTIMASSDKKVIVEDNKKDSYTKRMKMGGTGSTTERSVSFTTTDAASVALYVMSSSGSADRVVVIADAEGNVVEELALAAGKSVVTLKAALSEAGTYYIYSKESGINIYALTVKVGEVKEPTAGVEITAEGDIYVAPGANGNGTKENPADFVNALTSIDAGETIHMAAGTYKYDETIIIEESNSGTANAKKSIIADGDAVIDFSDMGYTGSEEDKSKRGIILDGSYWYIKGITITEAADNGMLLSGDNNVLEQCVFEANHDSGLQVSRYNTKYDSIEEWPSNNLIKNCTSFNNSDIEGENADGFAAKLTCGEGNVFDGCLAYCNSDDGWDLYAKTSTGKIGVVTIKNCIAFRNGKLTDGTGSADGDMNGFKLGSSQGASTATPHIVENCIAFENGAHGFTDNGNKSGIQLINCTSFNNSAYSGSQCANFQMNRESGGVNKNLLSFTTSKIATDGFIGTVENSVYYNGGKYYYVEGATEFSGKEKLGDIVTVSEKDFVSITAPASTVDFDKVWRDENGNLDLGDFLKVASDSDFAAKATDGGALGARIAANDSLSDDNNDSNLPNVEPIESVNGKIDVWDMGAAEFNTDTYTNKLTADIINSWYPDVEAGTAGKNIASFEVLDKDGNVAFCFADGGYSATHRLRTSNTALTRYDSKELSAENAAGETLTGFIYSNKSATDAVYVGIRLEAGDILTAYVSANSGDSTVTVESPSADKKEFAHTHGSENSKAFATKITYYAPETGLYKIYCLNEKLLFARAYVEHTQEINVVGKVNAPAALKGEYSVVFTCEETGAATKAAVKNGAYSAVLREGYTYEVTLDNADGYVVTSDAKLSLEANAGGDDHYKEYDVTVGAVELVKLTGNVTGLSKDALQAVSIALEADEIYVPTVTVKEDGSYTATVESNIEYKVVEEGIEDYQLVEPETVKISKDTKLDIVFEKKPVYKVTINPVGAALEDLADASFVFTRHSDEDVTLKEDYVYTFTGPNAIELRDGVYTVTVKDSGKFAQQLTSNLKVDGADITKTIKFSSEIPTSWDFRGDDYTGQESYNGLTITNGKKHTAQYGMMIKNGTVEIPVSGEATINVSVGYNWDIIFDDETEIFDNTNSGDKVLSYDYTGKAGTYTLTIGGQCTSYIKSIQVIAKTDAVEGDIKVTVGKSGCDYKTINDALDAIREMNRKADQRATIEIQPGNYEEMLVIDVPNVSLVNAKGSNTSIKPVNKGVDIETDSVRITSYYGHGYTYYSMGSDCKYSDEILAVNKENGYASFENPGSGTTNGSYWNATVVVSADGFEAEGIIFENSFNQYVSNKAANDVIVAQSGAKEGSAARADMKAGDTTVQNKKYVERAAALAIANNVNKASFDHCSFIGRQDTLYGGTSTTAAFYDCDIYGGTDYIFGGMTAVFAKCNLVFNTMEDNNDVGYITAAQQKSGRGYLMYNCTITSTEPGVNTASAEVSKAGYLGRPWQANTSEVVYYATVIEAANDGASLIAPIGWNSTLGGTSDNVYEFGTYEMVKGVDNNAARADWAKTYTSIENAKLNDGTEVSVKAFLGDWDVFAGKDMEIVTPDGKVDAPSTDEPVTGETTEFTLEGSALTAFGAGAKADGEEEKAGTDNYFTLVYSAKSKVDSSNKEFEDGYTSSQRINLGGKVTTEKNAVKFTTNNAATVKIWWAEGGEDNRQMAILNASGEQAAITDETVVKNAVCISTLELAEAGTYYLGGATNNNYIFKVVVTEEKAAEPIVSTLDTAADLTAFGAGAKADGDEEKAGTDEFFTIIYSAKSKVDSSNKEFEDGYTSAQRLNLGGKVSVEKNAVKFTTGSAATVKLWWVEGGEDNRQMAILNASGEQVAITDETLVKNAACISTLELTEAGTYYLGGATNNNYIFKIEVTESNGAAEKPARADWSSVAAPQIKDVTVEDGTISVTVKAEIGYDGADYIIVSMTDKDGKEIASKKSSKEGSEVTVSFTPDASGTYVFSVTASREDCEDKVCEETKSVDFVLPLETPNVKSATSLGGGSVEIEWDEVPEAESYLVSVKGTEISVESKKLTATVDGLEIGKEYTFEVVAVRGEDKSEAGSIKATVVDEKQRTWAFAAYGSSTNTSGNGYTGNANDGSVTVYSEGGKGKIVPGSTDGLAFYYTEMNPETENFTLTADIHVDNWKLSNGQEGFGMMVSDTVGKHGDGTAFWNNSFQNIATKMEYYYDGEGVTADTSASKISMKLGLGSIAKTGVTAADVAAIKAGEITMPAGFSTVSNTLETSCAELGSGTYNIVGNYEGAEPTGTQENLITDFRLQIQRNNTGYILRYLDKNDNVISEKLYYDLERNTLTQIDKDSIYVGFFASRNARITVTNISLTTIAPEDDAPAEEREIEYVYPVNTIESATFSNSAEYDLVYYGNADGKLVITNDADEAVIDKTVEAETKTHKTVTLHEGENTFTVTFTPNADYKPGEFKELTSYETVTFTHTVLYSVSERNVIYVSPNGEDSATGTKKNPMTIYQAVKVATPGTKIVVMEGTYLLSRTVKVERGIDGTADNMIYMIADPEASERPVFDFQKKCAGMVLAGDYWYFQGFAVTHSADAQKGIQVSGDHNVLDNIHAYENGNTGIQISRYLGTDNYEDWPAYNTILNCTSYLNADKGYEDADGFAAKLTVGDGNVFDGCIAAYNADDGWDLFAKVQTGSIGSVTIKNSLAFKNGYVIKDGKVVDAGNGNGFKMGGDSMPGAHVLKDSIAFGNKAKGFDSNSCPDIKVYNSISFDNESYNVAFYTNTAVNTNFEADGIISYKKSNSVSETFKLLGTQDSKKVYKESNYYFDGSSSKNTNGVTVTDSWFKNLDMEAAIEGGITRNADGTINMNGFLELTEDAKLDNSFGGTPSEDVEVKEDENTGDNNTGDGNTGDGSTGDNTGAGSAGNDNAGNTDNTVNNGSSNGSSNNSSSSNSSSGSTVAATTTVTINDEAAPLASSITGLPNGYEQVTVNANGILRAELLNKYYGTKTYFAAIMSKDFGITFDMVSANVFTTDLVLKYTIVSVPGFAPGFATIHAIANQIVTLPAYATLHFNVGAEHAGKAAYVFAMTEDKTGYELKTVMSVNEIGNVAFTTQNFTDVMILIEQ